MKMVKMSAIIMTDISNRKYCQIDKIRNDATIKRNEPTLTADICRSRLATLVLSNMAAKTASIDIERNYATVAVCIKTAIVTPPAVGARVLSHVPKPAAFP